MSIEELESKHFNIPEQAYRSSEKHTKLSVQFTIGVLEEIKYPGYLFNSDINYKIQELKQYLDDK